LAAWVTTPCGLVCKSEVCATAADPVAKPNISQSKAGNHLALTCTEQVNWDKCLASL